MGQKLKPWSSRKQPRNMRNFEAKRMIVEGVGRGGPMRDRRDRRASERNRNWQQDWNEDK